MPWSAIVKLLAGVGLPILAMFSAWLGITRYGDSQFQAGQLNERVTWELKTLAATEKRAAERDGDEARVNTALTSYANRMAALRPIIAHSTETVVKYAQTDAGGAPCLSVDRVRGIEADAAALGLAATPTAERGNGGVQPDAATHSGSE